MSLRLAAPLFLLALVPVLSLHVALARTRGASPAMLLRALASILLVLALAQPQLGSGPRTTVLVVDRSASVDTRMRATEAKWLRESRKLCSSPCRVVELADGARALPESVAELSSPLAPLAGASDLEQGVLLGLGLLPHGGSLTLLSDGAQTQGEVLSTSTSARAAGVRIDTVALHDGSRRDAALTRMSTPASVHAGDAIPVQLTIRSTVATRATLSLSRDGEVIGHQLVTLRRGENPLLLSYLAAGSGWVSFSAHIELADDAVPENDSLSSTTDVLAAPRVLAVQAGASLQALLAGLGFAVTNVSASALPAQAGGYAGFDAVVLDDVPAPSIDSGQAAALTSAVRGSGLGLVALGGAHSFSGGGYAHSALEGLLPVESLVPGNLQRRNAAFELVLDRSGSMIDLAGGYPKIEMVRLGGEEATQFAASHEDELGIVAFDAIPHLLVPLQRVTLGAGERRILAAVDGLEAEGGTNLYRGLQAGFRQLQQSAAPSRHMLLVTDGVSEAAEYKPLLREIRAAGVSVATVALGNEADSSLLKMIAHTTGGNFYATSKAGELPRIFAKESRFTAKPTQAHGSLRVLSGTDSPIVSSLAGHPLPALQGNELTNLKPGAQADLLAEVKPTDLAPALAQWQDGAGRVAAWTPGFGAPWASAWSGETELWNDLVRWSERTPPPQTLPEVLPGTPPALRLDLARAGAGAFALTTLTATLSSSTGARSTFTLNRTGPSIYTASLTGLPAGVYHFALTAETGALLSSGELAVPYSQEYLPLPTAATPLGELASATGGHPLSQGEPKALLGTRRNLWWVLALAALVLLLLTAIGEQLQRSRPRPGGPLSGSPLDSADAYEAMSPSRRAPAASKASGSTSVGANM